MSPADTITAGMTMKEFWKRVSPAPRDWWRFPATTAPV
jgi:hypothetical protein